MSKPKQLLLDVRLDESASLENFLSCPSTEIVLKASKEFISGSESNRTLYLWGKRGTGKQYLMHAVNRTFLDNNFHSAFLSFLSSSYKDVSILEGLEKLDIIFIDAFENFPTVSEWEIALFNLLNACSITGSKVFISSQLTAKNLKIRLPDLKSRLIAFPAFELPEVSDEEKIKALRESAERKGLRFDEKVLSFILNHTSRSLADLLKLLVDLDNFSLETKRKISVSLVKELLANRVDSPNT